MERIFDKEGIGMLIEWLLSKIVAAKVGMAISGTVNLTTGTFSTVDNSSLNTYARVFANMKSGEMRMYLVADSNGNLPSTSETSVTVPYDGVLGPAYLYFGKSAAFGVSVGDICVLFKRSSVLNVCRIIPLNDVKPASGDFPGADGLATVWDKERINKVDGIEWTANYVRDNYLHKDNRFPSRAAWLINVDTCLDNGVYPTCDSASINVGWTNNYFTCIVQRTSTVDNGGYHTIEQTAYGRGADEGHVYKRIIFYKSDGTDTQYGEWLLLGTPYSSPPLVGIDTQSSTEDSYEIQFVQQTSAKDYVHYPCVIPCATTDKTGVMSAKDKNNLDTCVSRLNTIFNKERITIQHNGDVETLDSILSIVGIKSATDMQTKEILVVNGNSSKHYGRFYVSPFYNDDRSSVSVVFDGRINRSMFNDIDAIYTGNINGEIHLVKESDEYVIDGYQVYSTSNKDWSYEM